MALRFKNCPIIATMKLLANQWNMIAIRCLHDEPMRFNQLRREMGNVSTKTLSRSLKHLSQEGIIKRRVFDAYPISVEYSLTKKGQELSDSLCEMRRWGRKWLTKQETNSMGRN